MEIMNPLLITKAEALPVIKASSRLFYRLFPFDEAGAHPHPRPATVPGWEGVRRIGDPISLQHCNHLCCDVV
ncbi:hypothetical protein [Nocardia sp. NPDC019255]|uniref:hypothetical protein n=1 Tax=Nocardia sp. NPDC019255 TaxID=3154591 RepID=UPI0033C0706D